jgi:hypothetical protein
MLFRGSCSLAFAASGAGWERAWSRAVDLEWQRTVGTHVELDRGAAHDARVRQVRARREPGPHALAIGSEQPVELRLGLAIAGVAPGHEIEAPEPLAGGDDRRRRARDRKAAQASVESQRHRARALPPGEEVGWPAEHDRVDGERAVAELEDVHGKREALRPRSGSEPDGAGDVALG